MPQWAESRNGWLTRARRGVADAGERWASPQAERRSTKATATTEGRTVYRRGDGGKSSHRLERSLDYVAMTPAEARDAFTRLLQTPEPALDRAEAALLIAAEEYSELRPSVYLEQIARMAKVLEDMYGGTVKMRPALLEPSTKRQILARILNHLTGLYLSRGDLARALAASDRIMLTAPHLTSEWRDRGVIQFQMRQDSQALKDFS